MEDKDSIKPVIESLIFASESALSLDRIANVLEGFEKAEIKAAVSELIEEYRTSSRGFFIEEVAGGYQFRTNPGYAPWLRKLFKIGAQKISKAAMETLAVIAYRQPVTRAELEGVRGVDSGGVLATLMEKRFIKIVGRKEVPGRPVVYGTTKEFLEMFDLKDLTCLPSLKDIQTLEEEDGFQAKPPAEGVQKGEQQPKEDAAEGDGGGEASGEKACEGVAPEGQEDIQGGDAQDVEGAHAEGKGCRAEGEDPETGEGEGAEGLEEEAGEGEVRGPEGEVSEDDMEGEGPEGEVRRAEGEVSKNGEAVDEEATGGKVRGPEGEVSEDLEGEDTGEGVRRAEGEDPENNEGDGAEGVDKEAQDREAFESGAGEAADRDDEAEGLWEETSGEEDDAGGTHDGTEDTEDNSGGGDNVEEEGGGADPGRQGQGEREGNNGTGGQG